MVNKKLVIGGVVLAVVVIVFVVISSTGRLTGFAVTSPIKTCKNVEVPYEFQESYLEQEPYQATEEYQVPLKYEVVSATNYPGNHGFDYWAVSEVKVRNVDSETGLFTVEQTIKTLVHKFNK
jgi:hypothetical protein